MADNIRVNPTPIQRNLNDVAIELTKLYYEAYTMGDIDEVQETYAKFYTIADAMLRNNYKTFKELLPGVIKEKV